MYVMYMYMYVVISTVSWFNTRDAQRGRRNPKILPEYFQNTFRITQNIARIFPEYSQNTPRIIPKYGLQALLSNRYYRDYCYCRYSR